MSIKQSGISVRTDATDQQLLEGLALSDRKSIEAIYKEHYGMVQALIVNNSGYPDDARDVFQEAMIVLYDRVRSGSFELNCQLRTYLYSVSRRLWLKRLGQLQRSFTGVESLSDTIPVEEELERHDQRNKDFQVMEQSLNALGEPCRSLIQAYYLEGKSMVQIACDFGYTNADNAKNQKYKCLMRLKKIFVQNNINVQNNIK
ncbi:MAG TPA: sigma-70 family RNA polymerase sigma factor [Puia sp.]|nr:sigma-70 family RNA polymerase sigma factor [Puia sp.]